MELLLDGIYQALTPLSIGMVILGTVFGVFVGAMPGLGSVIAVTIALPFTFTMPPVPSLALLLGVYCGSVYGGSISAILINTPGTPASAATALDGFPMAREGRADLAIGWATCASFIGGLVSVVVLILAAPQIAEFSLNFTPIEYFALGVFSLTCIASVSRGAMLKGILAGVIGLLIACVGVDPMSGDTRFTFGVFQLTSGIPLVPAVVGLFALSEVFVRVWDLGSAKDSESFKGGFAFPRLNDWKPRLSTLAKSVGIGVFVGALPGTGSATAGFIAYSEAQRSSPRRDRLGHGEPDGIVAAESSNNAVTGSALIPTLSLGIPGDPVTAIMLGALVIQGITPGPQLFIQQMDLVYAIFFVLIMANIVMLLTGVLGAHIFSRVLKIPEYFLIMMVIVVSLVGAYGVRGNSLDMWVALTMGVLGLIMRRTGFPIAPLVIGMVLSGIIETSLRQGLIVTRGSFLQFFESPIALSLFLLTATILFWPIGRWLFLRLSGRETT